MDANVIAIKIKIKKILKAKKLKYSDLASAMEMSESGVKKLLAGKDFSLNKLNQIADFLGLSITELIESSKEQEYVEHKLNGEIEAYFVNNWDCFCFYWLFVAELTPLKEIYEQYNLTFKDVEPYLLKLDSFGLLEFHSENQIVLNKETSFLWGKEGPLAKKMLKTWSHDLIGDAFESNGVNGSRLGLFSVRMGKETANQLNQELNNLIKTYTDQGDYDCNSGKSDLVNFSMTFAYCQRSFVKPSDFIKK